jgi:hypothetical protein
MGIIRLALRENWPERGLVIGRFLREFAQGLYAGGVGKVLSRSQLDVGGLGSFIFFHKDCRRLAAAAGVLPSATGSSRLRWLPTFDSDFENTQELQQLLLGWVRGKVLKDLGDWGSLFTNDHWIGKLL